MRLTTARNGAGSSRSAASRISATTLRATSGGGIDSSWVCPLSSVSSRGTSAVSSAGRYHTMFQLKWPGRRSLPGPATG